MVPLQKETSPIRQATINTSCTISGILWAHYQMMVWNSDTITNPELLSSQNYGWWMDKDEWLPVMTTLAPAPEAVTQLVKCGCSKEWCSTHCCQCHIAGLHCTDLCNCSDTEKCKNASEEQNVLEDDKNSTADDSETYNITIQMLSRCDTDL